MNEILAKKIAHMSPSELLDNMFRDTLTGAWNRRAFEQTDDSKWLALIDLDSLKWINDNLGHRQGDKTLIRLFRTLEEIFPDQVFRVAGDEFIIRSDSINELFTKLGIKRRNFSVGLGATLIEADKQLHNDKRSRMLAGLRAVRGEKPPHLNS